MGSMGVTVLHAYPVPADKTAPQVVELIKRRITNLGCTETGQFQVDCETYHSSPNLLIPGQGSGQIQRTLHVLHNSEYPATVFSVLEPPAPSTINPPKNQPPPLNYRITFTTDYLFDLLLLKLSSVYQKNKQNQKIESKGNRYEIGDFVVKLGIVSVTGSVKGILVEVEYLPCLVVQSCWSLIIEFMQGFLGSVVPNQIPAYLKQKTEQSGGNSSVYTPSDTTHQYLECFANFRKGINTSLAPTSLQQHQPQTNVAVPNR